MISLGKWIEKLYPMVLGIIVIYCCHVFDVNYKIHNFEKVLDNSTVFSSIVVGFLGALLGILVSIKDSEIVKKIFESNEKNTLKFYFNETFMLGLLVVILSSVMQVMLEYNDFESFLVYYFWLFTTAWFIPSTYRIINILMKVFFKSNSADTNSRPAENSINTKEEANQIKQRLMKP